MIETEVDVQHTLARLWVAEEEGQTGIPLNAVSASVQAHLKEAGWVQVVGDRLVLTPAGREEAARAIRRRRLAERLLHDVLLTDEHAWQEHACRLEHALVAGLEDRVCTLLGHPRFCPHGNPIPPGPCCKTGETHVPRIIAPLSDMSPGERGVIAYVHMQDDRRLHKLLAMGILPGVPVEVIRHRPSVVFRAGLSQFAVDESIAGSIYVRLEDASGASGKTSTNR